jgi:hypothetical protein
LTAASFSRMGRKLRRNDSLDALKDIRNNYGAEVEDDEILLKAAEDEALDVAPVHKNIEKHPDISTCISDAATKSWNYAHGMDWKALVIVTAGVVLGGAMHITRNR